MSGHWVRPGRLTASDLQPPPSKSHALRMLALSHLLGLPPPRLEGELPTDIGVLQRGLEVLRQGPSGGVIDCRDGGAPLRILLALAATTPGADVRLTGTARLAERPHVPLLQALQQAAGAGGARIEQEGTPWPLRVIGPTQELERAAFAVDAGASSQFATALVLAAAGLAARTGRPVPVELHGPPTSAGYLQLTLEVLRAAGVPVDVQGPRLTIGAPEGSPRQAQVVPADWSSAAYLLAIAWRSGGRVLGLDPSSHHPDAGILRHLRHAGLEVRQHGAGASVAGVPRDGLVASAADTPDLIPTLAALAVVLPRPSVFERVSSLRVKESDRLAGTVELVEAFGGRAVVAADRLTVLPAEGSAQKVELDSADDHRRVMSATTLAILRGADLLVHRTDCVAKSFPGFFDQLRQAAERAAD